MPGKHHSISTLCHLVTTVVQGATVQFEIARMHQYSDHWSPLLLHSLCQRLRSPDVSQADLRQVSAGEVKPELVHYRTRIKHVSRMQ